MFETDKLGDNYSDCERMGKETPLLQLSAMTFRWHHRKAFLKWMTLLCRAVQGVVSLCLSRAERPTAALPSTALLRKAPLGLA